MTLLFIPIETPTKGRGGCSRMTVSSTAKVGSVEAPAVSAVELRGGAAVVDENAWVRTIARQRE